MRSLLRWVTETVAHNKDHSNPIKDLIISHLILKISDCIERLYRGVNMDLGSREKDYHVEPKKEWWAQMSMWIILMLMSLKIYSEKTSNIVGQSLKLNLCVKIKVPKGVLKVMESIRSNFFKGASMLEKKISWIAWDKVLASKKKGGFRVSSYFRSTRAHPLERGFGVFFRKMILCVSCLSKRFMGIRLILIQFEGSIWSSILKEVQVLKSSGFDFLSYCSKRIGDGQSTSFWKETWMGDIPLCELCPRLFALRFCSTNIRGGG
ncbi:hypothetical protein Tco_0629573 [Tanacetum coccineum]|uniref:Reverse transcriptase n=1 Tax=Tanacetum coccineum TaxID=301880 RepID=A0ABQ4WTJ2_9ASTR